MSLARGSDGLAALAQTQLSEDPFCGHVFVFRGRKGDRLKILWWSGDGSCLLAKRLERGHFVWPQARDGSVQLTCAQLSMLLEGIESGGTIMLGQVAPIGCAAVASDESYMLAALTRNKGESILELLEQLDRAVRKAT